MPRPNTINPRTGKRYDFVDPARMADAFDQQLQSIRRQEAALKARDDLLAFTQFTMPDPSAPNDLTRSMYEPAAFHKAIATHLEELERGEFKQLILTMPPRAGKTELATKRFVAWFLGRNPSENVAVATYSDTMAEDYGSDIRHILNSPQHKQVFPKFKLRRGGQAKSNIQTETGGRAVFVGVGGALTGRGAGLLICDDLIKGAEEARSQTMRNQTWEWFTKVAMTRRMGRKLVIIIMTRWHSDDVVGRLTDPENPHYNAIEAKKWKIIKIPAIAEEDDVLGRKPGEPLWPERYDLDFLQSQQRLDPLGFSALYQQSPTVADGTLFRRETLQYYKPDELPTDLRVYCASDHAVGTNQRNDPSCFLKVGVDKQSNIYLLDCIWQRMPADEAVDKMLSMAGTGQKPLLWWAERGHISKSLGPFLRKRMQETGTYINLVEVTPAQDKETRAQSIAGRVAMGKVYFPKVSWWTEKAINELLAFPNGTHDDFCVVADTRVAMADGSEKSIAAVRVGDDVMTPAGPKKVTATEMTSAASKTVRVEFSNGRHLEGTGNHPVFVTGKGFVRLDTLTHNDVIFVTSYRRQRWLRLLSTVGRRTGATLKVGIGIFAPTISQRAPAGAFSIGTCGRMQTDRSPKGSKFTTQITTLSTTPRQSPRGRNAMAPSVSFAETVAHAGAFG